MEGERLKGIVEGLRSEKEAIDGEVVRLRNELSIREGEAKRIGAALAALEGKQGGKAKKKSGGGGEKKPAATKGFVVEFAERLLQKRGVLELDELKQELEKEVLKSGKSKVGLGLRLKQALEDSRFVDSPGGVRLVEVQEPVESGATEQAEREVTTRGD